ncbi:extracellular solute-binding protein [Rhizobium laguerreae]|uniref:extracellular solute-binding protein n=1 Tax=Rhizobium laguerreae TaxID=1076926 RepID=UPI00103D1E94|nr:extracellular solute-binding protein [Rhizobium laguerreae]TBX97262.1 extracellular solute-binding protein [Rhizobium laguerreae]
MQKWTCVCTAVALAVFATAAKANVVSNVAYALPSSYKSTQEEIAKMFEASHPGIKIVFRAPLGTYDDVVSDLLRSKATGGAPDVAYVGMNHIGLVADRGLAVPLDGLVKDARSSTGWDIIRLSCPLVA